MRKKMYIVGLVLILILMAGCNKNRTYSFTSPDEQISNIEIVNIPTSFYKVSVDLEDIVSVKTIPTDQWEQFLSDFHEVPYSKYYFEPSTYLAGTGIRITYQDGSYEIIEDNTVGYVVGEDITYPPYYFDEDAFNSFIKKYTSDE